MGGRHSWLQGASEGQGHGRDAEGREGLQETGRRSSFQVQREIHQTQVVEEQDDDEERKARESRAIFRSRRPLDGIQLNNPALRGEIFILPRPSSYFFLHC